jgi:hypothetical protein
VGWAENRKRLKLYVLLVSDVLLGWIKIPVSYRYNSGLIQMLSGGKKSSQ